MYRRTAIEMIHLLECALESIKVGNFLSSISCCKGQTVSNAVYLDKVRGILIYTSITSPVKGEACSLWSTSSSIVVFIAVSKSTCEQWLVYRHLGSWNSGVPFRVRSSQVVLTDRLAGHFSQCCTSF